MKYIKKAIKILSFLLMSLILVVLVVRFIDSRNTRYLKIKNHPNFDQTSYLITNINIVPMSKDTVLNGKTVFIKNGIIENISDSIVMEGVEIIDGQNKFLSPGLVDMHTHVWDKQELGLYLANGVTTIRNLWGYPMHLRIKRAIENNKIMGPMFYVSSPKLTGSQDTGDDKVQIESREEAVKLVKEYKKRGFDFIKTYAGLTQELHNAVVEQSVASDISIIAHPSREIPYLDQFHAQIASLEHAEEIVQQALAYELDSLKLESIIKKFVNSNKSFCPTLTGYYKIYEMLEQGESILSSEPVRYINPLIQMVDSKTQLDRWTHENQNNSSIGKHILRQHQFHLYMLNRMHEAGVNIICGTDAGIGVTAPGYSIHQELELYTNAGMSNYEALKTATVNPSKTHRKLEQIGTIEKGKYANLIMTSKNPLEYLGTLNKPEWIMIKGRIVDKKRLEMFVEKARDRNNLISTALNYAEYLIVEK